MDSCNYDLLGFVDFADGRSFCFGAEFPDGTGDLRPRFLIQQMEKAGGEFSKETAFVWFRPEDLEKIIGGLIDLREAVAVLKDFGLAHTAQMDVVCGGEGADATGS